MGTHQCGKCRRRWRPAGEKDQGDEGDVSEDGRCLMSGMADFSGCVS